VECAYHRAGACRSCTWIERPYAQQLLDKQEEAAATLSAVEASTMRPDGRSDPIWADPVASAPSGFRTTAKMVVGGTWAQPTLGILDRDRRGVDLRRCPIVAPPLREALAGIARFIAAARLVPYDVPRRSGELKYVLVTTAEDGRLLVRFVLRSRRQLATIRRRLPLLREWVPGAAVVTANIHPTHEAVIEGPDEIVLSRCATLPLPVGDVILQVGPRSFVQTNTGVAAQLYRQVAAWVARGSGGDPDAAAPRDLWDLYCGVGGFALHAAHAGVPSVTGVEISDRAIDSAREGAAAQGLGPDRTRFIAADATQWARSQDHVPDAVVVNPPRRGIGTDLAQWLDGSGVRRVVYSSCFPESLSRDLAAMPHLRPVRARLFDMFPHTAHAEVAVLLERPPA